MIDNKFFRQNGNFSLKEIASWVGGKMAENSQIDYSVSNIAPLDKAGHNDLAYCEDKLKNDFSLANIGILLIRERDFNIDVDLKNVIFTNSPRASFAIAAAKIISPKMDFYYEYGNPILEENVIISKSSIIADCANIGSKTIIGHNVIIGPGVKIGRNCIIEDGVIINCAFIGDNVRIGANSVIGKAGFGVAGGANGPIDVPQFGRVIIQDNVTIGALCTIDRGAFDDTIIGMNSKIDNHCHIAHNVKLGQGVIIAAFGGISGSAEIGDFVMMGGRVGVGDHFKIGNFAKIAAGSAVLSNVPTGETFAGYPAKPRMRWLRETIALEKLAQKPKK